MFLRTGLFQLRRIIWQKILKALEGIYGIPKNKYMFQIINHKNTEHTSRRFFEYDLR